MEMKCEGKPADYAVMRWNATKYFVGKIVVGQIDKYTMVAQCTNEVHAELVCNALNMAADGERTVEQIVDEPTKVRSLRGHRKYAAV